VTSGMAEPDGIRMVEVGKGLDRRVRKTSQDLNSPGQRQVQFSDRRNLWPLFSVTCAGSRV
jgi:hypothetical protein